MRTPRTRSIRVRIFALLLVPLLALVPLWGFAVFLTAPDGLALLAIQRLQPEVGVPSDALGSALAAERKAALVHLANPDRAGDGFAASRAETDKALDKFKKTTAGDVQDVARPETRALTQQVLDDVKALDSTRSSVTEGTGQQQEVFDFYSGLTTATNDMLASLTSLDDPDLTASSQALARTSASRDLVSQEDALLAAAIVKGRLTPQEYSTFVQQVGAVKASYGAAVTKLPEKSQGEYRKIAQGPAAGRLHVLEDAVIDAGPGPLPSQVDARDWDSATGDYMKQARELELSTARTLQADSLPLANGVLIRAGIAAVLGLLGIVLSIIITMRTGRRLIKEITDLKTQVQEVASEQLPNVVRRLREGRGLDLADLGPSRMAFDARTRELDDLNWAFDEARRVAIQAATGEARLRENVNDVIVNLARRNQTLLHRQLKLFDQLERRVSDPDELRDLFVLDHLATRMRRHAESLLILTGTTPGRGWSKPMPVQDVVRAAGTEVEEYTRVSVFPMTPVRIVGGAVTDVIHLLAELIENATLASPPTSEVLIRGRDVANGFAIEIEDGGLGMGEQAIADANALLSDPPELDLAKRTELGHFVVGTLAKRHGIKVHMRESPYGGITAIVLLSRSIIVDDTLDAVSGGAGEETEDPALSAPATGRHTAVTAVPPLPEAAPAPAPVSAAADDPAAAPAPEPGPVRGERNGRPAPAEPRQRAESAPEPPPGPPTPIGRPEAPVQPRPEDGPRDGVGSGARRRRQLPQRVRQANLVPQLKDGQGGTGPDGPAGLQERPAEQTRSMMSALQAGWTRGRNDDDPATPRREGDTPPRQGPDQAEGDQ